MDPTEASSLNVAQSNKDNMFSKFGDSKYVSGSREFLMSNTATAKFAFLIMVVIIFVFMIRLSMTFLTDVLRVGKGTNPMLIDGLVKLNQYQHIKTTGDSDDTIGILRSANEDGGMEFTYTMWLKLSNGIIGDNNYVLRKISDTNKGASNKTGCPDVFISKASDQLKLTAKCNTYNSTESTGKVKAEVENLPINKWFHLGVRLQGKFFDVIINGNIKKRVVMGVGNVAKQNNYDIHVAPPSGEIISLTVCYRIYNITLMLYHPSKCSN